MKSILILEDGKKFLGESFGASGETSGEVVFNTSHTGYQEILTDPSYKGQIVTMTYPHIGNYGVNLEDIESRKPFIEGFIVKEYSKIYSNWRAKKSLGDYLKENKIVGIEGIDTRALVKHIREKGSMKGFISTVDFNEKSLLKKVKSADSIVGKDLVKEVTNHKIYKFQTQNKSGKNVVVMDFGVKTNILRSLSSVGLNSIVVPANTSFEKIIGLKPSGIMLSNGPGDPEAVTYAIETVKKLISTHIPIFGICLGHQILGLAMGGKTYKLKFGHHGSNQPIKNLKTERVQIAAENHNFAVNLKTLKNAVPTHKNLNDGTLEGIRYQRVPVFSVQFHPEASPGPHDSRYLFIEFLDMVLKFHNSTIAKSKSMLRNGNPMPTLKLRQAGAKRSRFLSGREGGKKYAKKN
ncbi:MAG: carbamoyl phosphate synthase small subunit [Elusimicrobia bacterium RIFOXYD2_FULL_34_15]|nr:MAG: carbamoyl phosphate synthase small subunit [Elusimicrobia bacterium RIFOXYD2_FULL_34_15]